jgi:uncharacterized membrane protein YheB (UPF0754 family)
LLSYFLTPLLTAGIGWFTNWVAVKMLFLPLRPKVVLGIRFQGLIPKRQMELAEQCAEIVERELLQQHLIRQAIEGADIGSMVESKVRILIREKLLSKLKGIPMLGAFLNETTIAGLEDYVVAEMRRMSEELVVQFADHVEQKLQVKKIVRERIEAFDLKRLQEIIEGVAAKEFRTIEWVGAILGFLVGVAQSSLLYFQA